MVTTRSQYLSSRVQTGPACISQFAKDNIVSLRPLTRSETLTTRSSIRTVEKCPYSSVTKSKQLRKHTTSPYATRSRRMNTRSNAKRFIELSTGEDTTRMTRSMSIFVDKYSNYTDMKPIQ